MTSRLLHLTPGGVISPKPVITPPKHIKSDATRRENVAPDAVASVASGLVPDDEELQEKTAFNPRLR